MLYQKLALSNHWFPRFLRIGWRFVNDFSLPAPRWLTVPLVAVFLSLRWAYYFVLRVFFCEPFFKAHCTSYGKRVHTGVFFHWFSGRGRLIVGDHVTVDGMCSISFAARYSPNPTLIIGDHTGIGHKTTITVGDRIQIGRHCRIGTHVFIFDAPGHPLDPELRRQGKPSMPEEVKPVVIEDNVWIGSGAVVLPGVTIGEGSVVAAGSVVMTSVPRNALVAGNPARMVQTLKSST